MREKIYFRMLEIATQDPGKFWSINELVAELKKSYKYDFDADRYICYWYLSHFGLETNVGPYDVIYDSYKNQVEKGRENWTNKKSFLTKDSYYSFIETQELKESREASLKAQKDARTAIWIAAIAFIAATFLQVLGFFTC